MTENILQILDKRTGKSLDIAIQDGTIKAIDLRNIKISNEDFGLMTYDPGYMNTASCRSAITFIDGDLGILRHRGYPIEEIAESRNYIEVVHLLLNGTFPSSSQFQQWLSLMNQQQQLPDFVHVLLGSFPKNAHPMTMLISGLAALAVSAPMMGDLSIVEERVKYAAWLLAQTTTLVGYIYSHILERPKAPLSAQGSYAGLFWQHVDSFPAHRALVEKALDALFILHADHEQNCSTATVRQVGSSQADLLSSVAAGSAALFGPLHGGANEAVLLMIEKIGSVGNVPRFVEQVKSGEGKLMGFGHRVYKNYDPRAKLIKKLAQDVFQAVGVNPGLEIALELERIALSDDYFVKRKLYPNVDFYSGLIYQSLGLPTSMFTCLFAVGRMAGWIAQWVETRLDPEQKLYRPRQIYTGPQLQHDVPKAGGVANP